MKDRRIALTEIALEMLTSGRVPTFGSRTAAPDDPTPIYDDLWLASPMRVDGTYPYEVVAS